MILILCVYLLPATKKLFIKVIKNDLFESMLPKFASFSEFVSRNSDAETKNNKFANQSLDPC